MAGIGATVDLAQFDQLIEEAYEAFEADPTYLINMARQGYLLKSRRTKSLSRV